MAFPTGYTKYQNVTIDASKVDATLTDFPVLIDLSDLDKTTDIFDTCRSDCGDIRITLSDGTTQLAREIVSIDTTGKTGELHVKIPSLSSSVDTVIQVWYNGTDTEPAEDSTYGKENTWNSGYKMVHHMNQDPSGSAPQMIDSTSNDNNGTSSGSMTSDDLVDAQIGDGLDFDGTDDYIDVGDGSGFPQGTANRSISAWFKATSTSDKVIFSYGAPSANNAILFLLNSGKLKIGKYAFNYGGGATISLNTWYFGYAVIDASDLTIYLNGSLDSTSLMSNYSTSSGFANIASYNDGVGAEFPGILDEVRISDAVKTSDWVSTEYNNQSSPGTFYSVSDEQTSSTQLPINCTTGAVAIQGINASVSAGSTITGTTGSLSITGIAATVSNATTIAATTGDITISGINAEVSAGTTLTTSTGSVSISGVNADISAGKTISAITGAINVAGINASVSAGSTIIAAAGAVSITGITADISNGAAIIATTGAVSISGIQANISAGKTITASTGPIAVTGIQATVINDNSITATTGAVSIQGIPATITAGTTITAATGTVSITGIHADVENGTTITATTGALAVAGIQADITSSVIIEATTGLVIITGIVASISSGEIPETPVDRIYSISEENRVYSISEENRVYSII